MQWLARSARAESVTALALSACAGSDPCARAQRTHAHCTCSSSKSMSCEHVASVAALLFGDGFNERLNVCLHVKVHKLRLQQPAEHAHSRTIDLPERALRLSQRDCRAGAAKAVESSACDSAAARTADCPANRQNVSENDSLEERKTCSCSEARDADARSERSSDSNSFKRLLPRFSVVSCCSSPTCDASVS